MSGRTQPLAINLLVTCKAVRRETVDFLYSDNRFRVHAHNVADSMLPPELKAPAEGLPIDPIDLHKLDEEFERRHKMMKCRKQATKPGLLRAFRHIRTEHLGLTRTSVFAYHPALSPRTPSTRPRPDTSQEFEVNAAYPAPRPASPTAEITLLSDAPFFDLAIDLDNTRRGT